MCTLASYRSNPNTIRDGLKQWNNNSAGSHLKKLSRREKLLFKKHKKLYPRLNLYQFSNQAAKPVKLYSSHQDKSGTFVFNVNNSERQRSLPGPDAHKKNDIHFPTCDSMLRVAKLFNYDMDRALSLVAKVLFEEFFKENIWRKISLQDREKSILYLACLESDELAKYMDVDEHEAEVKQYIKNAFKNCTVQNHTGENGSTEDLVSYYRHLNPKDGTAADILKAFDQVVDSSFWFGDILDHSTKRNEPNQKISNDSGNKPTQESIISAVDSYPDSLINLTFENQISRVLDQLQIDFADIKDSKEVDKIKKEIVLLSSQYKAAIEFKKSKCIKDKAYLQELGEIRTKLLDLITRIGNDEILYYLRRQRMSADVNDLDQRVKAKILSLKAKMIQYDHKYLSFFMLDIDNFTVINIKYSPFVGNRILSKIEAEIEQFFTQRIGANLPNERKFIGDWIHRDKYLIIMAIAEPRAIKLAKEFTRNVKEDNWSVITDGLHITISGGVSGWNKANNDFEKCIVICSEALDRAKMAGKNSVQRGLGSGRRPPIILNFRKAIFSFLNSL